MKIFISWLSIVSGLWAADTNYLDAAAVLKIDGVLLLSDGSSYYAFKSDGSFHSFPMGMSGRCFTGTWKKSGDRTLKLEVLAKLGWQNGTT